MKSIKSIIIPIATVATAFSCGVAGAESITVKMESVREDSVEHLFQPSLMRGLVGPQLIEGRPEIPSIAGLEIHDPQHASLSFEDSPAEPIVIVGQDNDGQDIAFAVPIPLHSRSNSNSLAIFSTAFETKLCTLR